MNSLNESVALTNLLGMLAIDSMLAPLCVLLILAAVIDLRTYRIPNWLCASGICYALLHGLLTSTPTWYAAPVTAIGGLMTGAALMLPMYLFGVLGAGDVKLTAMAGAFLSAVQIGQATIIVFIVGGIAALVFSLRHRALQRMLRNAGDIARSAVLSFGTGGMPSMQIAGGVSVGRLPYGVSIAIGTILYVVARQIGYV